MLISLSSSIIFASSILAYLLFFILGWIIYVHNRKGAINKVFFILTLSVVLWMGSVILRFSTVNLDIILIAARLSYATATIIGFMIYYFCSSFPIKNIQKTLLYFIVTATILVVYLSFFTPYIIANIEFTNNNIQVNIFGFLFYIFAIYFPGVIIVGIYNLLLKYHSLDRLGKTQVKFILTGIALSTFIGFATNFIVPVLAKTTATEIYGPFSTFFFILLTSYAITKHHLFDIKVITTELFTFALWIVLLIKIFFSNSSQDFFVNIIVFLSVVFFGILLIRSVLREVRQREQIEQMAGEVKKAYEVEKKANAELEKLDKLKNQFMMTIQHHLKTPLTSIMGYSDLLLNGTFGKQNKKIKYVLK